MIVAVLSDIHANLPALDAVLASLGTVDAVWHLGDVVGYGAEPDGVVERLRDIGAVGVKGNHDDAACGGPSIAEFNPTARIAAEWTRAHMSPDTREYLTALPPTLAPVPDFTLAHGSPRDPIFEYVLDAAIARENLGAFQTPYCLIGHTHYPVAFRERHSGRAARFSMETLDPGGEAIRLDQRRTLVNPGSVGQPRDGNPAASYAMLDTDALTVTWRRVAYDVETARRRIVDAGLPRQLGRRLEFGE